MTEKTAHQIEDASSPKTILADLTQLGQSFWLDFVARDFVRGGDLKHLIEGDGIRGLTSNPTIFQKAMAEGNAYDDQINELVRGGKDTKAIFEALAVKDIQDACDLFRPLYDRLNGRDGFVSIEVSPGTAHDTAQTLVEARRLWQEVNRPNVMIKVPGTAEGAEAVGQLLSEGINVNITLLFSLANHERVMWKYIEALEARVLAQGPIDHIASVASFFVSRVDTLIDDLLDKQIAATSDPARQEMLRKLHGQAAIANAKLAYARFEQIFGGERFAKLRAQGAQVQRPLWASTSTKNPHYRDVIYIEELIGPDTVNTLPLATLKAFEDHGTAAVNLTQHVDQAEAAIRDLEAVGISYDAVTQQLENEGVQKFTESYNELIDGLEKKRQTVQAGQK